MGWVRIVIFHLCLNLSPCLEQPTVLEVRQQPYETRVECEYEKPEGQLCAREDWLKGVTR